jgi:hypothetical protein
LVNQSLMAFMEMDQPSEASRIGGDDVKFLWDVLLSGDVATIRYVFNSEGRLQFYFISLFLKWAERLKFKY